MRKYTRSNTSMLVVIAKVAESVPVLQIGGRGQAPLSGGRAAAAHTRGLEGASMPPPMTPSTH